MAMLAEKRRKNKFVLNPLSKPLWTSESSKFGRKMMEKMGWSAGKGLGASEQGIQEPLRALYKQDSKGMGYSGNGNPFENLDQFNALLSSLSGEVNSEGVAHSFESLEEKSKHSRSRVHYKKFTRSKDVSRYSNVDLSCIVGLGKKVEEAVVEEDVDHTGEEEHTHGVTTINSGSISDYFKLKMNQRKGLQDDSLAQSSGIENVYQNQDENIKQNINKRKIEKSTDVDECYKDEDIARVCESNEKCLNQVQEECADETAFEWSDSVIKKHSKSKKKKRKSKDVEEMANEPTRDENLDTCYNRKEEKFPDSLINENLTKKKKKRRKEVNSLGTHEEDISNCKDSSRSEERIDSQSIERDSYGNETNFCYKEQSKREKRKKRSHDEKDESNDVDGLLAETKDLKTSEEIVEISLLAGDDYVCEKKKKHRKKRKEIEENDEVPSIAVDNESETTTINSVDANNDDRIKKNKKRKVKAYEDENEIITEQKIKKVDDCEHRKKRKEIVNENDEVANTSVIVLDNDRDIIKTEESSDVNIGDYSKKKKKRKFKADEDENGKVKEKKHKHRKRKENDEVSNDSAFLLDNERMTIDDNMGLKNQPVNTDQFLKKKKKQKIKMDEDENEIITEENTSKVDVNEANALETTAAQTLSNTDDQHQQVVEVSKHFKGSNLDDLPGYGLRRPI